MSFSLGWGLTNRRVIRELDIKVQSGMFLTHVNFQYRDYRKQTVDLQHTGIYDALYNPSCYVNYILCKRTLFECSFIALCVNVVV